MNPNIPKLSYSASAFSAGVSAFGSASAFSAGASAFGSSGNLDAIFCACPWAFWSICSFVSSVRKPDSIERERADCAAFEINCSALSGVIYPI